jgi:hypothetical protein
MVRHSIIYLMFKYAEDLLAMRNVGVASDVFAHLLLLFRAVK